MNEPVLRPAPPEGEASAPCPPGCVAEAACRWNGQEMEAVYNPDRHRVAFLGDSMPQVESRLRAAGWEQAGRDESGTTMWVLDQAEAARSRLARLPATPTRSRDLALP